MKECKVHKYELDGFCEFEKEVDGTMKTVQVDVFKCTHCGSINEVEVI